MQTTTLGHTDIQISKIAYGCWRLTEGDVAATRAKIEAALEAGMTLIDTADIYGYGSEAGFGGAEELLGQVLKETPALRDQMVLATKGGIDVATPYNSSYDYLIDACDVSLKRLQTDYVDLYQIHRPDLFTSFEEMGKALDYLVVSGKTRTVGVSNFTAAQFRALQANMETRLVSHQPEFSAWCIDPITDGVLDQCQEVSAACLAWSPLAGGALVTGDGSNTSDPVHFAEVLKVIDRLAETHSVDRTQIALAFVLHHPANVVPIVGTQTPERIAASAKAAHVKLSPRDWYDILEARRGAKMP